MTADSSTSLKQRAWPAIVDAAVMDEPVVSVGGGGFGINVHLAPDVLVAALGAEVVAVSAADGEETASDTASS